MTRPVRRVVRGVQMLAIVSFSCGWPGLRRGGRGTVKVMKLLSQGQITARLHPRHRIMAGNCRVTTVLRANHLVRHDMKWYRPLYLLARYLPCLEAGCAALYRRQLFAGENSIYTSLRIRGQIAYRPEGYPCVVS